MREHHFPLPTPSIFSPRFGPPATLWSGKPPCLPAGQSPGYQATSCAIFKAFYLAIAGLAVFLHPAQGEEDTRPNRRPLPRVEAIPLPYAQVSVTNEGNELIRYHFGADLPRPFWYPLIGPGGRSYTRMGHPHDPVGHGHHNSLWIAHADVGGVSFWADSDPGKVLHSRLELLEDGQDRASVITTSQWVDTRSGKVLMVDRRYWEVAPLDKGEWYLTIRLELSAPKGGNVTLGTTPFGLLGVRVAKTISVADGGGRILNSEGGLNEKGCFRLPARWVDYSGPVTPDRDGGITIMDHPENPSFPTPFHVRDDGWFCPAVTLKGPIKIEDGQTLRLT
ncbi:MAG: PmoA family protein, partial [Thermoguttaceae bacterium]|nr:PmoA family protein [Thermoguttaceae bacterium]